MVKHKGTLVIYNKIPEEKNIRLKMQIHEFSLDKEARNMDLNMELR
jgi:hypothetical protein